MADVQENGSSGPGQSAREENRARFELELEFVQALANPFYIHSLAQQNYFNQPSFVNYLKYLQYWKKKEYARFIHYPHALHHLELLQHEQFRNEIGKDEWREYLHRLQFEHWRSWRVSQILRDRVTADQRPTPRRNPSKVESNVGNDGSNNDAGAALPTTA